MNEIKPTKVIRTWRICRYKSDCKVAYSCEHSVRHFHSTGKPVTTKCGYGKDEFGNNYGVCGKVENNDR